MKIAVVFDGMDVGGIERVGCDHIRLLAEAGNAVDVYNVRPKREALVGALPDGVRYFRSALGRKACPEFYCVLPKRKKWGKWVYPWISAVCSVWIALRRAFVRKRDRYDYAVAFSGHINDLNYVTKNFVKAEKKIAWLHGTLIEYLAIHDGFALLFKKTDKLVVLNEQGQNAALYSNRFLQSKEIFCVPNPTNILSKTTDPAVVDELKEKYGDFVLMTARIDEPKDHKTAIDAVRILAGRGRDVRLVFLGDGPLRAQWERYAKETGAPVFFEGIKTDVQNYNAACKIGLLCSRSEGLPTVAVEAMSFGKPYVISDCDGGAVSAGGRYCLVVPVGDAEETAEALDRLLTDEKIYREYEEKSKIRAQAFQPDSVREILNAVFSEDETSSRR